MGPNHYRNMFGQFYVLLWKNILLEIRNWPSLSISAIFSYVVVIFLIRYLDITDRTLGDSRHGNDTRSLAPTPVDIHLRSKAYPPYSNIFIAYAPSCPATDELMAQVKRMLIRNGLPPNVYDITLLNFYSEFEMVEFATDNPDQVTHAYAFDDVIYNSTELPKRLTVIMRPTHSPLDWMGMQDPGFDSSGEVYLIKLIMEAYINNCTGIENDITILTQMYPENPPSDDPFLTMSRCYRITTFMILVSAISVARCVYLLAKEREKCILTDI
ncbi:uncharacterized protein LOC131934670 [Physella acuta]|uniref:uncharacterized protein LOC131934670 n=1 Tax=Physella acuta TaxID=109671 RepID=UPI0027DD4E36|nr:uncharacterized protein LOC131934670 [Physella acuta]